MALGPIGCVSSSPAGLVMVVVVVVVVVAVAVVVVASVVGDCVFAGVKLREGTTGGYVIFGGPGKEGDMSRSSKVLFNFSL